MSQFAVYERDGEMHAIHAGFSWPAFIFSGMWAFAKQMPGRGIALIAAIAGPLALGESGLIGPVGHAVCHFAPVLAALTAGSLGNSWWRSELENRGFDQLGTIEADSAAEALSVWNREALLEVGAPAEVLEAADDGVRSLGSPVDAAR